MTRQQGVRPSPLFWAIVALTAVGGALFAMYLRFIDPPTIFNLQEVGVKFALLSLMGLANDIYAQVGLVMLVGLLSKNAVLIVEFATQKHTEGMSVAAAAVEGAKVRFRPILMTSFAFVAGLIPLVRATGPGAIGNRTIGSCALGGMLFGTIFGVIIVPGLYYVFGRLAEGRALIKDEEEQPLTEEMVHHG